MILMKKNKKLKIVVTGGLGHIGSALIRDISPKLIQEVVIIDNISSQRYASLFDLPSKLNFKFYEDDIRTADLDKYFKGVDIVIHLAAITDATSSFDRQKEVEEVNLGGLKRVADACLRNKIRLFFPSSTSVYGSQAAIVDETCQDLVPQSPYAETKLAAERYLKKLSKKGLKFVVCRFGTIFGWSIGMRFHTAVNKFVWQAILGRSITVWRTAWKQRRPYLDLTDAVKAIEFFIIKDLFDGEIYNILTKNFTVEEIVKSIKVNIPSLKVVYVDTKIMNQLSYDVNCDKVEAVGFKSSGNLKKSLQIKINKLKSVLNY